MRVIHHLWLYATASCFRYKIWNVITPPLNSVNASTAHKAKYAERSDVAFLSLTGSFLRPPGCPCHTSAAPYHTRLNEVHGSRLSVLRRHTALVFCSFSTSLFCVLSRWDNQSPTICRVFVFVDLSTLYKFSQSGEHSKAWYLYAKNRAVITKSATSILHSWLWAIPSDPLVFLSVRSLRSLS